MYHVSCVQAKYVPLITFGQLFLVVGRKEKEKNNKTIFKRKELNFIVILSSYFCCLHTIQFLSEYNAYFYLRRQFVKCQVVLKIHALIVGRMGQIILKSCIRYCSLVDVILSLVLNVKK